ncbi:MAG: DUF3833 domain-containing protein [Desulfobulbaceae bacterium]|nr:DUF3833 domain-containing protein [Desulfobulbaceae bacterium]
MIKQSSRLHRLIITVFLLGSLALAGGCSKMDVHHYDGRTPRFDIIDYFSGQTRGWGIVQDRFGNLKRQFVVDIAGHLDGDGNLVLEEDFSWDDGELSRRVWTISRIEEGALRGRADDVVGEASGETAGNVLNWQYKLELVIDGSTWVVALDDWMFLQPDNILLNRAEMSKFGIRVGDVTIAFQKQPNPGGN